MNESYRRYGTLLLSLYFLGACSADNSSDMNVLPDNGMANSDNSDTTDVSPTEDQDSMPPSRPDSGETPTPIFLNTSEGIALIEPAFFEPVFSAEQPFIQPAEGVCDQSLQFEPEPEFNGFWFSIETLGCDHGTAKTTLKQAIRAGQLLVVRFFHFTIVRGDGDWALTLAIGNDPEQAETVHQVTRSVPAPTNVIRSEWIAERDYSAGETLWWNARNHGLNSWSIMSLTAFNPSETCELTDQMCSSQPNCTFLGECAVTAECRCKPREDTHCAKSKLCELYGLCGALNNRCIAIDDASCAASIHCEDDGLCAKSGEECLATTELFCLESLVCINGGKCTPQDGHCIAATDADCEGSQICQQNGQCSALHGTCLAANDEDCADSAGCKYDNQCSAVDGLCVTL